MHLFNASGAIQRFSSAQSIISAYFPVRLALYHKRRAHLLSSLSSQLQLLTHRARFIRLVQADPALLAAPRRTVEAALTKLGFPRRGESEGDESSWEYLLGMRVGGLVTEEVERLEEEKTRVEASVRELEGKTAERLWEEDLDRLRAKLEQILAADVDVQHERRKADRETANPKAAARKRHAPLAVKRSPPIAHIRTAATTAVMYKPLACRCLPCRAR